MVRTTGLCDRAARSVKGAAEDARWLMSQFTARTKVTARWVLFRTSFSGGTKSRLLHATIFSPVIQLDRNRLWGSFF